MKELLVIIPAYNEEKNILGVVNDLRDNLPEADILVVNDCSSDGTAEILERENVNYITTPFNLRYSGGVQTGFKYALKKGYTRVAQFDGDGQHVAGELRKMYKIAVDENLDIAIGSRFIKHTEYKHSFFRKIGTSVFQKIIKTFSGQDITDPTSGLQVLSKRVYTQYSKMNNYPEYPDANLLLEMLLKGYKVKEISVEMKERIFGESMHAGIWSPFKYMITMFYSIFVILVKYKGKKVMKAGEIL